MMQIEKVKGLLLRNVRPAVHLVTREAGRGFSKLGGLPRLPAGVEWPRWQGSPLLFLGQVDLSELPASRALGGCPSVGRLYFFYDQEQSTWGFRPEDRGSWRVLYSTEAPADDETAVPEGMDPAGVLVEKDVEFREIVTVPDPQRFDLDVALDGEAEHELDEWLEEEIEARYDGLPQHQMGGYPKAEQSDCMEAGIEMVCKGADCGDPAIWRRRDLEQVEKEAASWRLLFQMDSDDDLGCMWGDEGKLYFWVREDDLRKAHFDNVWMVLQCG